MGTFKEQEIKQNHTQKKPLFPFFLISVFQEVKGDGHKDQEQAVPTIKSKFIGCVAFKINEKNLACP